MIEGDVSPDRRRDIGCRYWLTMATETGHAGFGHSTIPDQDAPVIGHNLR